MAKKREEQAPGLDGGALTHNPFQALAGGGATSRSEPGASPAQQPEPSTCAHGAELGGKLVVRYESKGRKGKTVTRISGVGGDDPSRALLLKTMKRALGVGAALEGGDLVLQGQLVERAAAWLEARGAKHVVRGNALRGGR